MKKVPWNEYKGGRDFLLNSNLYRKFLHALSLSISLFFIWNWMIVVGYFCHIWLKIENFKEKGKVSFTSHLKVLTLKTITNFHFILHSKLYFRVNFFLTLLHFQLQNRVILSIILFLGWSNPVFTLLWNLKKNIYKIVF